MKKAFGKIFGFIEFTISLPFTAGNKLIAKTSLGFAWLVLVAGMALLFATIETIFTWGLTGIIVFGVYFGFVMILLMLLIGETVRRFQAWANPFLEKSVLAGRFHIHYQHIFALLLGAGMLMGIFYVSGFWTLLGLALGGFFLTAAGLVGAYRFRYSEKVVLPGPVPVINFGDNTITFVRNYYFRRASVRKNPLVHATQVNEILLHTQPPCAVINQNEIVFFNYNQKKEASAFAERNNIPISKRKEIWEFILRPYLDTSYDDDEEFCLKTLEGEGLPREEVRQIRKRIAFWMYATTYTTLEWVYYGHFDALYYSAAPFWKNFYWRSMEIALRNFGKEKRDAID